MSRNHPEKRQRVIIILSVITVLAGAAWAILRPEPNRNKEEIQDNRFLLDTVVNIHLYGTDNEKVLDDAFDTIERYEKLLSRHKSESDISRLNSVASGVPVVISDDSLDVLITALRFAKLSDGAFDPTVGPLVDLWGIGTEHAGIPDEQEIQAALKLVDYRQVSVDTGTREVSLQQNGMTVDLGAVAKGWIADRIAEQLRDAGVKHILINLGGNVLVSGGKPGNTSFRIGMQNPFDSRGAYLGVFNVKNRSIVSSGVYERYFEFEGVRYHHILNTANGFPVDNGLAAVTVLTEKSVDGDALSTTLFAMGLDDGLNLVKELPNTEAAFCNDGRTDHSDPWCVGSV